VSRDTVGTCLHLYIYTHTHTHENTRNTYTHLQTYGLPNDLTQRKRCLSFSDARLVLCEDETKIFFSDNRVLQLAERVRKQRFLFKQQAYYTIYDTCTYDVYIVAYTTLLGLQVLDPFFRLSLVHTET
jgi:hypothetical protein